MESKYKGFTLIELSIVLTVLFLMAGGIIGGASLIRTAKAYALIQEIDSYLDSVNKFQAAYDALPGDIYNATTFWPTSANGNNNNAFFDLERDIYLFWQHLSNAEIIVGSYTGHVVPGHHGFDSIGENVPRSEVFPEAGFAVMTVGGPN